MLLRLITLTSLCLSLSLQQPKSPTSPSPKAGWELGEQWEGLLGTWELTRFEPVDQFIEPESVRGNLLIQRGFLSLIMHSRSFDEESLPLGQAGVHRWHITKNDILQTATMRGHSNMGQDFAWEAPNIPREFQVKLTHNLLSLTRPDQSQLHFRRLRPAPYPLSATKRIQDLRAGFGE